MVEELRLILPNGVEWFCGNDRFRNRGSQSGYDSLLACLFLEVRGNLPLISPQWGKIETIAVFFWGHGGLQRLNVPPNLPHGPTKWFPRVFPLSKNANEP